MSYQFMLKSARKQKGCTLREAAAAANISFSTIYRYEEGIIARIPRDKLEALLCYYGLSLHIFNGDKIHARQFHRLMAYHEESRQFVTAEFLYDAYRRLDTRGRLTVLTLLLKEAEQSEDGTISRSGC